jgi:hypothetical protein
LTPAVLDEAQRMLDEGLESAEVADPLEIKRDTLSRAVRAGRLRKPVKKEPVAQLASKSERSSADRAAPIGHGRGGYRGPFGRQRRRARCGDHGPGRTGHLPE